MPIKIPDSLPAARTLESENVFIMTEHRALHQDIRPLRIAIVNIMPTKIDTETQLLRLLGNTPLQVEVELLQMASHTSKNTSAEHLFKFYKTFDEIKSERFDGLIITGAPVELMPFCEVEYWKEICSIMDWAATNVYSTLYICWASQAGLYYKYGINKRKLPQKLSGIYEHKITDLRHPLTRGFDDRFFAPHSRYTETPIEQIAAEKELYILAQSKQAGAYIVTDRECRNVFVSGHAEYSRYTLANEYSRDVLKGLSPAVPVNYFENDDPKQKPKFTWKSHANMLYANWLNHIVYMHTPYDLSEL